LPWVKFEGGVNENEKRLDGRTCHTLSINAWGVSSRETDDNVRYW
jgi:hypothetical protein